MLKHQPRKSVSMEAISNAGAHAKSFDYGQYGSRNKWSIIMKSSAQHLFFF